MLCRKASDSWVCAANAHINKTFRPPQNKTFRKPSSGAHTSYFAFFVDKISLSVDIICLNLLFILPLHHSFKNSVLLSFAKL